MIFVTVSLLLSAEPALAAGGPAAASVVLQASARGMACAIWYGGAGPSPGIGQDCVNHVAADSTLGQEGGPWWGAVDLSTGQGVPLPGVTDFFDDVIQAHGNAVPVAPGQALGYATLNSSSGPYAVSVTLPTDDDFGSVAVLGRVTDSDWSPSWSETVSSAAVITWTYVEFHDTAAQQVGVQELLQLISPTDGSVVATLGNVSTLYSDGVIGPAFYGFGHAVDSSGPGTLFTQSGKTSVKVLDISKNKSMPALDGTAGVELMCMYFDPESKQLGGIVNKTTTLELVSIDTTTGKMESRSSWNSSVFPGELELLHHDDKPDRFGPMCTFDQSSGTLAFVLLERDAAALRPGWDLKHLFVATLDVRNPPATQNEWPGAPIKVQMPFHSAVPLGNRTWRAFQPEFSFLQSS